MDNKEMITYKIRACEMKLVWRTGSYTKWDYKRNEDILGKLKIKPVIDYVQNYQKKWNTWTE